MPADLIPHRILSNAATDPNRPAYYVKDGGAWRPTTWSEYGTQVRAAARGLIALGVEKGDVVTIIGSNRPEWVMMDVAAMMIGAVPAGVYTTNSPSEVAYILNHSESPVFLVEDESQWHKVVAKRDELPHLRKVVTMKDVGEIDDALTVTWDQFIEGGEDVADDEVDTRLAAVEPDDLATLIYTSGTTGPPKGVMLSADNLAWTPTQAIDAIALGPSDTLVSYLPLSHIAEQMFTIHAAASARYAVYYCGSMDDLPDYLKEVQPTIFAGVPRVWEKFQAGIQARMSDATGVKAKLAQWALGVGKQVNRLRNHGEEPGGLLKAQYTLADRLVFSKVKTALGFSRLRYAVTAAAPISEELLEFLAGLDVVVYEIYGQSEGSGPTTISLPGKNRFEKVGPAYPGVEVKIGGDGEILLKGRNVFLGYYKDDAATAETLIDGWLHSGDLGQFDDEGILSITGRKKDIIITAGGKNIAPKPFETSLKNHRLVSECVVIGDRRKYLVALVTLDEDAAAGEVDKLGEGEQAHESKVIRDEIQLAIDELNSHFARVEQVKKFAILPRQLTIEDGELTPTLKVKRNKVTEHFSDTIEELYAGD